MFMLTRGRMDCTVLGAAEREAFFQHYAARSAATRRDGKTAAEVLQELEQKYGGMELRRWRLKEGVLERMRCNWCGSELILNGVYIRVTVEPFGSSKPGDGRSKEEGPAEIANILPRLKCKGGAGCERDAGDGGPGAFKSGATHVAFPPSMLPSWHLPLQLVADLALAQLRLALDGFSKPDPFGIMELSKPVKDEVLAGLLRKHGRNRWLWIASEWLNRGVGRRALRDASSLHLAYRGCFAPAHAVLARLASGSAVRGALMRRRYKAPEGIRPLSCLLAFLLTWPVRARSSWPLFHPWPLGANLGPPG